MAWIVFQTIRGLRQRSNELVKMYRKLKREEPNGAGLNWLREEIVEFEAMITQKKKEAAALFDEKENGRSKSLNHLGEAEDFKDSLHIIGKEGQLSS